MQEEGGTVWMTVTVVKTDGAEVREDKTGREKKQTLTDEGSR